VLYYKLTVECCVD